MTQAVYSERTVFEHLESFLGPMADAEKAFAEQPEQEFKIVRFAGQPIAAAETYATLGVSGLCLSVAEERSVRQELVFACYARYSSWQPQDLLHLVGADLLSGGRALIRGQVLGPAGPLFPASSLEALYCGAPMYFDDRLRQLDATEPKTIIVWLVPISATEAAFIHKNGWNGFDDVLSESDPDLLDLQRPSVV